MARPYSMPELSRLPRNHRLSRDLSLATNLMMVADSSQTRSPDTVVALSTPGDACLFYAYAIQTRSPQRSQVRGKPSTTSQGAASSFTRHLLTFASARVAHEWWRLVQQEYPNSTRESAQFFSFNSLHGPDHVWPHERFKHLRRKWFYRECTAGSQEVIPLRNEDGSILQRSPTSSDCHVARDTTSNSPPAFDFTSLSATLDHMQSLIQETSSQVQALSVGQSEGLCRMQQINETNAAQIKSLAETQSQLQSLVAQNASHVIALSNAQFSSQEFMKELMQQHNDQIRTLIRRLGPPATPESAKVTAIPLTINASGTPLLQNLRPPPRKLERRVIGYEYESPMRNSALSSKASSTITPSKRK